MSETNTPPPLPPEVRQFFVECGRKGGSAGSKAQKSAAGKKGMRALRKKIAAQAGVALPGEEPQNNLGGEHSLKQPDQSRKAATAGDVTLAPPATDQQQPKPQQEDTQHDPAHE